MNKIKKVKLNKKSNMNVNYSVTVSLELRKLELSENELV